MMRFRLGIDLDGVLADHLSHLATVYAVNDQAHLHAYDHPLTSCPRWDYPIEVCADCFREAFTRPDYLLAMPLMRGVTWALEALSLHFELHVITSRDPATEGPTYHWLHHYGLLGMIQTVIFTPDKKEAVEQLHCLAHVDDSPKVVESLIGTATVPVVFDAPYNQDLKVDLLRYGNWPGIVGVLTTLHGEVVERAAMQAAMVSQAQQFGGNPIGRA